MRITVRCSWCGTEIEKYESQIFKHNFCSRKCLANFSNKSINPERYMELRDLSSSSKHMHQLNIEMNPTRMTDETKKKIREARLNTGEGKTYTKTYGVHTHRLIAEEKLGRKLMPGEIVHHIDGNKRNNNPDNIEVLSSQSEHSKLHARDRRFWRGGDA